MQHAFHHTEIISRIGSNSSKNQDILAKFPHDGMGDCKIDSTGVAINRQTEHATGIMIAEMDLIPFDFPRTSFKHAATFSLEPNRNREQ